jgi:hypothetical protein
MTRRFRRDRCPKHLLTLVALLFAHVLAPPVSGEVPPVDRPLQPARPPPDPAAGDETPIGEPFDPSRCTSGRKGYVYWAARNQVFAFPFDPAKKVYARSRNPNNYQHQDIPPPADANEPEGCYGNPLRGGSVPYMKAYSAKVFEQIIGRSITTTFGHWNSHSQFAIPDERHLKDDSNELNKRLFLKAKDCQQTASGMIECHVDTGEGEAYTTEILKIDSSLLFSASESHHDVYLSVVADIPSHMSLKAYGRVLDSSIDLYDSVRLQDSFRVFPGEVDRLIPYFKSMIRYITAARVEDYRWKTVNALRRGICSEPFARVNE